MKKIFLVTILCCLFLGNGISAMSATTEYGLTVKNAISKYKTKNYAGAIQDLRIVVKKDPSNAVAHYYLASSYMKIGMKDEALSEFDKVISLGSVPSLTSYSIQAKNCIAGKGECTYVKLTSDQVKELQKDPENYIKNLQAQKPAVEQVSADDVEVRRLINGSYHSNIHPEANRVIIDTLLKQQKHDINTIPTGKTKSEVPTNDEIAEAVKTLAKVGINPLQMMNSNQIQYPMMNSNNDYATLSKMMGNSSNNNNNSNKFMNMLPFFAQAGQGNNSQLNSNMVQAMMMSQLMPNLDFDTNNK